MNYSKLANAINIFFLAALVSAPIGYCLYDTDIPIEVGRTVIVLVALLGAFVLADWYHFYMSNSYRGLFGAIILGVCASGISLAVAHGITSTPIETLAFFEDIDGWGGLRGFMRSYVAGLGITGAAIFSIPRLLLIKLVGEGKLPN